MKAPKAPLVWILFILQLSLLTYSIRGAHDDDSNVLLIKIGGSSITVKDQKETLNEEMVQWFAETIADIISPNCRFSQQECTLHNKPAVILVHGAGSFGHYTAKEFGLTGYSAEPLLTTNNHTMEGVVRTRQSVQKLNQRVVAQLVQAGVKAVGISPCFGSIRNLLHTKNHDFQKMIQETLQAGLVPVLHGDACLCGDSGAAILSGDTLVQMCSPLAHRVVFLTDVDGVFNSDPKANPAAELIPEIPVDKQGNIMLSLQSLQATESAHSHDVTGGFKTKLAAAIAIAAAGRNVTIANSGSSSAEQVLRGTNDGVHCTKIFRQE